MFGFGAKGRWRGQSLAANEVLLIAAINGGFIDGISIDGISGGGIDGDGCHHVRRGDG